MYPADATGIRRSPGGRRCRLQGWPHFKGGWGGVQMIDDVSDIAEYYNRDPDREHQRLERHQLEVEMTWRYLERFLPPGGSILEVGAASGRYTLELARGGFTVTAVDMSAGLLEVCRQRLEAARLERQVRLVVADARNLGAGIGAGFDAVLLMGPLYHLVEASDREAALTEAASRLREGGLIFSAFISRFGILGDLLKNVPDWIEKQADVRSVLERGRDPEDYPREAFRGYFVHPAEVAPFHEALGFETLALAGVEPAISADDESYNRLEAEQRRLWLDLLFALSVEPSVLGASRHLLYVGRKK